MSNLLNELDTAEAKDLFKELKSRSESLLEKRILEPGTIARIHAIFGIFMLKGFLGPEATTLFLRAGIDTINKHKNEVKDEESNNSAS